MLAAKAGDETPAADFAARLEPAVHAHQVAPGRKLRLALQQPVLGIPPQFGPPLLNRSAFTGGTFPEPIVDDPNWYPTGGVLQLPLTKIPNVVPLIPLAGHPYCLSCHATAVSESTFASMDNILGEELVWRGVSLPRMEARLGERAWALNAALWGAFHSSFGVGNLLALLPTLTLVPWIAQRRRNTWLAVLLHAGLSGPGFVALALGLA